MLMVTINDRVGALLDILNAFVKEAINVRQIENRPVPAENDIGHHAVRFFLEVSGHFQDESLKKALESVGAGGGSIKILGSYPSSPVGE
jgi:chorismate mutase/prephenate dehydratase